MYVKLEEIPIWPSRVSIDKLMPRKDQAVPHFGQHSKHHGRNGGQDFFKCTMLTNLCTEIL